MPRRCRAFNVISIFVLSHTFIVIAIATAIAIAIAIALAIAIAALLAG